MVMVNGARRGGGKEGLWPKRVQCETRRIRSRFVLLSPPAPCATLAIPADTRLVIAEASMANVQNVAAVPAIPIPL